MKKISIIVLFLIFTFKPEFYSQIDKKQLFDIRTEYDFALSDTTEPQDVSSMLLVDINSDEYKDIVFLTNQAGDIRAQHFSFLITFINDGNGSFSQANVYNCRNMYYSVATGLINNDLFNDIVLYGDSLCILLNDGKGNFQFDCLPSNLIGDAVTVSKLNTDDYDDIVVTHWSNDTSFVTLLNDGSGVFKTIQAYKIDSGGMPADIACPDLNNDGNSDISLLISRNDISATIYNYLNDGNGNFNFISKYDFYFETGSFIWRDINKDSYLDVVVRRRGPVGFIIVFGNGDGSLSNELFYRTNFLPITSADFNCDGYEDIALTSLDSLKILLNNFNSSANFLLSESHYIYIPSIVGAMALLADGDINNDGDIDLVISNYNSFHGGFTVFENSSITTDIKSEEENLIFSEKFKLIGNYPNPFNPTTVINYYLPTLSFVELKVYDLLGKEIASLVDKEQNAGRYEVMFNGRNLSSGLYLYKLKAGTFTKTKIMHLLK
ncbi:MAG: T9SS type A sorting domain-containing protein [Melioribacteraceae bacterium]|nr:T9SS type A sorting domain-containing protein [Melioribacteraceae bacterium]